MKIFRLEYDGGHVDLVGAKSAKHAPAAAGVRGSALGIIDCIREVPSMTMTEIAKELGLPITETIFYFRGTFGKPKLGEGLFEAWTIHAQDNLVPTEEARKFINLVKEHRNATASQRGKKCLALTATA